MAVCGGPTPVTALWTSKDGGSWTRVDFASQFGSATVWTVDAGSTGYVATGNLSDGVTQVVWLSDDGRTWRRAPIPGVTFGTVVVQGATAFVDGYVIAGAVRGDEGCGGLRYMTPSLWWSSDGKAWSRVKLDGTTVGTDAWMRVIRISDRTLLAIQLSNDPTTQLATTAAWSSTDGRTWRPVSALSPAVIGNLYSSGRRCVSLVRPTDINGTTAVNAIGDDLGAAELSQLGDAPLDLADIGWVAALGPSGLLVVSLDGAKSWLGVPTAG